MKIRDKRKKAAQYTGLETIKQRDVLLKNEKAGLT